MSNWDLMMPGMGLTSIGLAGVTLSYAGIAHTFIDGMHALTGLTMFIGLIFLAAGILEGGVSTSNRAKATVLVITAIALSFGVFGATFNTVSTVSTFAGIMIAITFPAIILAYVITKMPMYAKPVGAIFGMAAAAGIITFVGFGLLSPDTYLIDEVLSVDEELNDLPINPTVDAPVYPISILAGSAQVDAPDYEPDSVQIERGHIIEWTNNDVVVHTATSDGDFGETFDTGLLTSNEMFKLDTNQLDIDTYDYTCVVHPFMKASFSIIEPSIAK